MNIGDIIREPLPPIDLGRVAAQTAKQVIVQGVRNAERERQFEDYKQRVGEVINGVVKRVEFGNAIIAMAIKDIHRAILPKTIKEKGVDFWTWDYKNLANLIDRS